MDEEYRDEDEISLVDLFVVLLRYRKFILAVLAVSLALAVAGYVWYPQYQHRKAEAAHGSPEHTATVEATLSFSYTPAVEILGLHKSISSYLLQPPLLLQALRDAGYKTVTYESKSYPITGETNRSKALYVVRKKYVEPNMEGDGDRMPEEERPLLYSESGGAVELLFRDVGEKPEKAKQFLIAVFALMQEKYSSLLEPRAADYIADFRKDELEEKAAASSTNLKTAAERYYAALELVRGDADPFYMLGEPYVFEPVGLQEGPKSVEQYRADFKVKAVVIVVAGLFLAVFLAFLLNAVRNVKHDEESMQKIREALGKRG